MQLGTEKYPKIFSKSEQHEAFFKKDHRFELPKMILKLNLYFEGNNTAMDSLCRQIYLDMLA